jgi:uncharacterized protein (TIGR00251 family)
MACLVMDTQHPDFPAFLKQQGNTLLVSVKVFPRSNRSELAVEADGLRVRLTAAPVEGSANEALLLLLAKRFRLPRRSVRVVRGATSRQKVVAIMGLSGEEFWQRLQQ